MVESLSLLLIGIVQIRVVLARVFAHTAVRPRAAEVRAHRPRTLMYHSRVRSRLLIGTLT